MHVLSNDRFSAYLKSMRLPFSDLFLFSYLTPKDSVKPHHSLMKSISMISNWENNTHNNFLIWNFPLWKLLFWLMPILPSRDLTKIQYKLPNIGALLVRAQNNLCICSYTSQAVINGCWCKEMPFRLLCGLIKGIWQCIASWPRGYKNVMLKSAEHEIYPAHKC